MPNLSLPRILIAEDDPDARDILAMSFSHWGYPLRTAAHGDQALQLATDEPVDVAILDMVMPGVSGITLIECLRHIDPDILIVVMTAYVSANGVMETRECGVECYLPKPCTPGLVRRVVDDLWQRYWEDNREWLGNVCVDWHQQVVMVGERAVPLNATSRRERDVLNELVQGKTDAQIALSLEMSLPTVRTHLRRLTARFHLSRNHLILLWDRCLRRRYRGWRMKNWSSNSSHVMIDRPKKV